MSHGVSLQPNAMGLLEVMAGSYAEVPEWLTREEVLELIADLTALVEQLPDYEHREAAAGIAAYARWMRHGWLTRDLPPMPRFVVDKGCPEGTWYLLRLNDWKKGSES